MRRASQRPARGIEILRREIRTTLDEATVIESEAALQPLRRRNGSRHHEQMPNGLNALHACRAIEAMHALQVIVTLDRNDLTLRSHFDRRILFDATDKVTRHAVGELALPHHYDDPVG